MPYPGKKLEAARLLRPSWVELDPAAIAHNVGKARAIVGPERKIYFVCKGDGFGFGADYVARQALDAGVDGLCVGSPEEAVKIRAAGIEANILMFACTLPEQAFEVADLDVIVTLQSLDAIRAFAALGRHVRAFVEVDCGFGRFGIAPRDLSEAFSLLKASPSIAVEGLYSHLSAPDDLAITAEQNEVFEQSIEVASLHGFGAIEHVLASSRVMIRHPKLSYTGVDPGRFIYGSLDGVYMDEANLKPLLVAVRGRIIHIQTHHAGSLLGLGYGGPILLERDLRLGIVPIGFWDGLKHVPPHGDVLVHGRRAPVVGRRTFQHTVMDITDVPSAELGTLVTLVGRDGDEEITVDEFAKMMALPVMELVPRLARSLPHIEVTR